jgi:hypothetical protein
VGQCSVETLGSIFSKASRQASCNYGIGADGRIGMYVEEKNRSWCTSSRSNDQRAITIEVASDTKSPYAVNSKAYAALINLIVDICKRNNIKKLLWKADKSLIGQIDKQNMTVHRWFANTACPGDYLYNKYSEIAAEVNKRLGSGFEPYLAKVTVDVLNIRKGPGTNYGIAGTIHDKGTYTIVEEKNGFGRLKSNVGWISLDYVKKVEK